MLPPNGQKQPSANTANKALATLGAVFQLAQRRNLLKQNRAQLAERIKISNKTTPTSPYYQTTSTAKTNSGN
jgi:hypothetical protein